MRVTARLYRSAISGFDAYCVALDNNELYPVNVSIEYAHGDCEFGFYPDWSRAADTEIGIQTGPFPITSNLAANVGYTVEYGSGEPIDNGSGFTFEPTDFVGAVSPYDTMPWWSGWLHTDVEDDNCPLVTNPDQADNDFDGRVMRVTLMTITTGSRIVMMRSHLMLQRPLTAMAMARVITVIWMTITTILLTSMTFVRWWRHAQWAPRKSHDGSHIRASMVIGNMRVLIKRR